MTTSDKPIIFFDGVCGLCNSFVDWVIRHDKNDRFCFAPIQGETARGVVGNLPDDDKEWSIIYKNQEQQILYASDAVLNIFKDIGGGWVCLSWGRIFPTSFRDMFYRMVAKRRYRWFGKKDQCRIPSPEERKKFLP